MTQQRQKNQKIDLIELDQLVRDGKSTGDIAKYFSVTPGAVSQAKGKLRTAITRTRVLDRSDDVFDNHLEMEAKIHRHQEVLEDQLNRVLEKIDRTKGAEDVSDLRAEIIKFIAESRKNTALRNTISLTWYDKREAAAFKLTVLNILERLSPGVRDEAIRQIRELKALRGVIDVD
jgi:hypothetical protein